MTSDKLPAVIEQQVVAIREDLQLAEALASEILQPGVDYGLHPGTSSYALKDPGANTVINAFGCYVEAKILFRQVDEKLISYVFSVDLVSRKDETVKATGTGAASTRETKYGYRWVTEPEVFGYNREELRHRQRDGEDQYRIVNPEWSELENTILKMARKRAEVDAAQALPGVARFIARLNAEKEKPARKKQQGPDWTGFWSKAHALGHDDDDIHNILEVTSMKAWTNSGRTLDEALRILAAHARKRGGEPHDATE